MPLSVSNQAYVFFYSIIGGMLIAFIYDIFRIKRKTIKTSSLAIYLEDLIYWIIVALVMFAVVFHSNDGELRGYIFIGTAIGTVVYILLLSKFIIKVSVFIIRLACKVLKVIWRIITYPIRVILKILSIPAGYLLKLFRKIYRAIKRTGRRRAEKVAIWSKMFRNIRKKI